MDQAEPPQYEQKPFCQDDLCDFNPNFAVICAFISHFGDKIELELDIEQLKDSIENQDRLEDTLIDLHVKLLRKIRRYLIRDQWERALINFAHEYSYEDALELQQLGYLKTRPSVKLELLKRLLDAQFESDQKFKSAINSCEASELRLLPVGRDIRGNSYWQRSDKESNFRIFQEEPLNYKSWKTVCKNPVELKQLIDDLDKIKDEKIKGEPAQEPYNPLPEIFPEYFQREEIIEEAPAKDKKTNGRRYKRGGRRGRVKKPSSLAVLNEADEASVDNEDTQLPDYQIKPQYQEDVTNPSEEPVHSIKTDNVKVNGENDPVESQVRLTIDNLLSRVASSFEFLIKPLSRSFIDNHEDRKQEVDDKILAQPRKKQVKQKKVKAEVELPRRTSSRIQQLQQKKEEEIKKSIESRSEHKVSESYEHADDSSNSRTRYSEEKNVKSGRRGRAKKESQRWRPGKGKKKLSWDKDDSDLSSISSPTESNEEELDETEKLRFDNNDEDEFACEEEDANNEPVIIKRARTARQFDGLDETGTSIIEEDKPCGRCDKSNDPEWVLLCDMCDEGYHTACCLPPLMVVPDGDWFCPSCEHKMLLDKLNEFHSTITELLEAKERERQKRQRLRQNNLAKKAQAKVLANEQNDDIGSKQVGKSIDDTVPVERKRFDEVLEGLPSSHREGVYQRSNKKKKASKPKKRRKRTYSDDEEMGYSRKKTYSRYEDEESEETNEELEDSESSLDSKPRTRKARACVSYRFQEYDELIQSAIRGDSEVRYEDDDDANEDDNDEDEDENEAECNYGRGKDMATIEALAYQQENGLPISIETKPQVEAVGNEASDVRKKPRKKSRRLNDLDAESEIDSATSDESFQASATEIDDEEEAVTEIDSDEDSSIDEIVKVKNRRHCSRKSRNFIDDDSDYEVERKKKKTKSKKRKRRKEDYYEDDDDEDESEEYDLDKKSKKRRLKSESDETDDDDIGDFYSESSYESKPKQRRARACVSYRFQEYDDLMKSAGQTESDVDIGGNDDADSDESFKASGSEVEDIDEKEGGETEVDSDEQSSVDELVDVQCFSSQGTEKNELLGNRADNPMQGQMISAQASCKTSGEISKTLSFQPRIYDSVTHQPSHVNSIAQKPKSPPHPPFYDEDEVRPKLNKS